MASEVKSFMPGILLPLPRRAWLEPSIYALGAIIFAAAIFTTANESVVLRFVHELDDGLAKIGTIKPLKGASRRRTLIDSLWLPLVGDKTLFEGDLISTSQDGIAEIDLQNGAQLTVQPESLMRVRVSDGKPLIRVEQGRVKVDTATDVDILLQVGNRVKEVTIRRGTYFIKNDDSIGIQISAYTTQTGVQKSVSLEKRKRARVTTDQPEDEKIDEAEKIDTAQLVVNQPQQVAATQDLDLPYPKDGTLFLVRSPRELIVADQLICQDSCSIKIMQGTREYKSQSFRQGDEAVIRISKDELQNGDYEWIASSQTSEHHGRFSIRKYSSEELSQAIAKELPIEIL